MSGPSAHNLLPSQSDQLLFMCVSLRAEASASTPSISTNPVKGTVTVAWTPQSPTPHSAGYFVSVRQTAPVSIQLITDHYLLPYTESFTFHLGVRPYTFCMRQPNELFDSLPLARRLPRTRLAARRKPLAGSVPLSA